MTRGVTGGGPPTRPRPFQREREGERVWVGSRLLLLSVRRVRSKVKRVTRHYREAVR